MTLQDQADNLGFWTPTPRPLSHTGLVYKAQTKAIRGHSGPPVRGANWVASRRGHFVIEEDTVGVGDWVFSVDQVSAPVMWRLPFMFFWKMSALEFHVDGTPYQFGFNPWARVLENLPFECEVKDARVGWSTFSIVIRRVLLVAALLIFGVLD